MYDKTAPKLSVKFETMNIGDMKAHSVKGKGNKEVIYIDIGGQSIPTTSRFWNSFSSKFHLGDSAFNYFSYKEVFNRIAKVAPSDANVRICTLTETSPKNSDKCLLAMTTPNKPIVALEGLNKLAKSHGARIGGYHDGFLSLAFNPRKNDQLFKLGGEDFRKELVLSAPIDGYGKPRIYLKLLRQICENGAIAMSPAFRTDINIGENPLYVLNRAIASYDNEEGFVALQQRFESAQSSNASIRESNLLMKLIIQTSDAHTVKIFEKISGSVADIYGVANVNVLSDKKQRLLPAKCRVYDLINFASEIATHKADAKVAHKFHSFIGDMLTKEFDLEGTATKRKDFADFFLKAA